MRTLKIMGSVFRRAMLEELQLDPGTVQKIFPCVDELSQIHERFLAQLLERRRDSLAQDSNKNFVINRLGDILVGQVGRCWGVPWGWVVLPGGLSPLRCPPSAPPQFSGSSAEQLKKAYSEFCSRHTKAVKEYKDLLARDKRFQHFVRVRARPHAAAGAQGSPLGRRGQGSGDPPPPLALGSMPGEKRWGRVGEPVAFPPPPPCLSFPHSPVPALWW